MAQPTDLANAEPPALTRPLVDRLVAATGGRALVVDTPGVGWLAIEVMPTFIWMQITGAMSLELFYFVSFLSALGVAKIHMPALTMAMMAAGIGMGLLVLRRPAADPHRRCVVDCLIGRCLWLGTVLGPLGLWSLGWSSTWILASALLFAFLGQLTHSAGGSSFITWTQALVPKHNRGLLYAWRNISTYLVVALVLFAVGCVLPRDDAHGVGVAPLAALLLCATVIGIAGIWPLAKAPSMPVTSRLIEYAPLLPQVVSNRPFMRFLGWALVTNVAVALSPAMQPDIYHRAGIITSTMATWQATVYYPAMLAGIIWSGRALRRSGARVQLLTAHVAMMVGEASLLLLTAERISWMMPVVQGCLGLGRGMWGVAWISRIQEIIPHGDPRFAALAVSSGAAVGMIVSIIALLVGPGLDGWLSGHAGPTLAWTLVAAGVIARTLATPFLLKKD